MQLVEIRVRGRIDADWSEWFAGLEISYSGENESVLTGCVQDQAALYGLLSRLRDLGLALVSAATKDPENGSQDWVSVDHPD